MRDVEIFLRRAPADWSQIRRHIEIKAKAEINAGAGGAVRPLKIAAKDLCWSQPRDRAHISCNKNKARGQREEKSVRMRRRAREGARRDETRRDATSGKDEERARR